MPDLPGETALHEFMVGVVFLLVTKVAHIHLVLKISPSPSIRLPDEALQHELDKDLTVQSRAAFPQRLSTREPS